MHVSSAHVNTLLQVSLLPYTKQLFAGFCATCSVIKYVHVTSCAAAERASHCAVQLPAQLPQQHLG